MVYPATHPGNGYRPTASCADFVRVRDGYCTEPGCTRSAFACDLDHVTEYDHTDPARGGATSSENLNAKCRPSHLFKTHGDWVDVQYRDDDGRLVTEYETPEGVTLPGDAETLEDTFPNLRRIRFEQAAQAPPTPRVIAPADNPRYVVGIMLDNPRRSSDGSGGQSAAPLFSTITSWMLQRAQVPLSAPTPRLTLTAR